MDLSGADGDSPPRRAELPWGFNAHVPFKSWEQVERVLAF